MLILDKAAPLAPLILGSSDADPVAKPLRPPEHRFRIATLLPPFEDPDTACLPEFVSGRLISRKARDDRPHDRIEPLQQLFHPLHIALHIVDGGLLGT